MIGATPNHHQRLLQSTSEENQDHHPQSEVASFDTATSYNSVKEALVECKKLWQIAAPSIFGRLTMFSLTVVTQSFAGHLGQRQLAAISISTTVLISITFGFLVALIFTSSSSVISFVEELAFLLAITILFNCIQPILSGVAVGSGWQASVAYINIGSYYFVGVPLGIILGWFFHFGIKGIWAGMICGTISKSPSQNQPARKLKTNGRI